MTTPDRTIIRNRADYALPSRNTIRPPSPRSPNQIFSQNPFSPLSPSFPPLPSKLATFSETVSGTSKPNNSASSSKSDTSDKMSYFPPPPTPITQPSQILHAYKSEQPKLLVVEPENQHINSPRDIISKIFPQIGIFNLLIQIRTKNFMSSSLLTLIQFFFHIPPAV
jgi:hypothetical protein